MPIPAKKCTIFPATRGPDGTHTGFTNLLSPCEFRLVTGSGSGPQAPEKWLLPEPGAAPERGRLAAPFIGRLVRQGVERRQLKWYG